MGPALRRTADPVFVVVLPAAGGRHAGGSDAVDPAEQRLLAPVLVEERRLERRRIEAAEIEDVPDLDGGLELQRTAALRTTVALLRLPQVGEPRLVVASRFHAAEMPARAVRAGVELVLAA